MRPPTASLARNCGKDDSSHNAKDQRGSDKQTNFAMSEEWQSEKSKLGCGENIKPN